MYINNRQKNFYINKSKKGKTFILKYCIYVESTLIVTTLILMKRKTSYILWNNKLFTAIFFTHTHNGLSIKSIIIFIAS